MASKQKINSNLIFIHSLFRSGSTYFYSALKRTDLFHIYHEPFHEVLADLPKNWEGLTGRTNEFKKILRHEFLDGGYFDEYLQILPNIQSTFDSNFSYNLFFMDSSSDSKPFRSYIDSLIEESPKHPILQCTRSTGRISWLKQNYVANHVFLLRNPWDQWYSYQVDKHIPATIRLIYSSPNIPTVLQKIMDDCEFSPIHLSGVSNQLEYCYANPIKPSMEYYLFFALWLYSYITALEECDLIINMDRVSIDKKEKSSVEISLHNLGIKNVNLSDCELHRTTFSLKEQSIYSEIENKVLDIFSQNKIEKKSLAFVTNYLVEQRIYSFSAFTKGQAVPYRLLEDSIRLRARVFKLRDEMTLILNPKIELNKVLEVVKERNEYIEHLEQSIVKRDTNISEVLEVVKERNEYIEHLEKVIANNNEKK